MMQKTNNFVGDKPLVPDGFEAIVSEHIGWVYHMARRQLADAGLAEDAVQAVLLALWQRRKRLEAQNRSIGGWLVRATYLICSQMRKSEARRRRRERKAIVMRIQEADVPAEAAGSNILQLAAMDAAMQKLSRGDRALLVARFFQNRTAREAAHQFNISEAAAAKRTARAVGKLRNIMARQRLTLDSTAMMALLAGGAGTAPDGLASQVLHVIAGQGPLSACAARAAQSISFRAVRAPAFLGASAALVGVAAITIPLVVKTPQRAAVPIPAAHAAPHITGPLTKNGYVNYVAKFNNRFGKGVTASNNAAVPLVILFRPGSFQDSTTKVVAGKFINVPDKTFARKLRRSLGIAKRDITGPRFVSYQKFRRHADPAAVAQGLGLAGKLPPAPHYTPAKLYMHPWSAKTNPWTAAFLNANAGALDIARSAFSRPRFFMPLVEPAGGDHRMVTAVGSLLPALAPAKAICNGLAAQAMLALHQGRLRRCRHDLLAIHRLARLLTREHFLITNLVAMSIETMGCQADIAMADSHKLSSKALRQPDFPQP
jgi:RNA polymerase sigma-70 factor (ECF subfamily)